MAEHLALKYVNFLYRIRAQLTLYKGAINVIFAEGASFIGQVTALVTMIGTFIFKFIGCHLNFQF